MSSSLDRLLAVGLQGPNVDVKRRKTKHPEGWAPGITVSERGGFIVSEPREAVPEDWTSLLCELLPPGMDPADFDVEGDTVEVRAWDSGDGEGGTKRLYYFKARIRRHKAATGDNLDDLIAAAKAARVKPVKQHDVERAYWLQVTDLQAGQADGSGVEGMVARALELAELAAADLEALKRMGKPATRIFVPMTGDLVEGVSGWYEMQQFSVQLDRRDQVKLVRRLLTELLLSLASHGLPVHVAVVPGNHGENRINGKAFTSLGDNDDVAAVEAVAEAFAMAGNMEHVSFSFPGKNRLTLTVEVLGWVVGLAHGHQGRYGSGTEGKILNWFNRMAGNNEPIGNSQILFTGHYHHGRYQQLAADTVWVQGGALCDASEWFAQTAGLVSDPLVMKGTITAERGLEYVWPHTWPRTQNNSKEIA